MPGVWRLSWYAAYAELWRRPVGQYQQSESVGGVLCASAASCSKQTAEVAGHELTSRHFCLRHADHADTIHASHASDYANILPLLQVIDLGSAEFVCQGQEVPHAFGTVRYSSPEMAAHSAGPASDVWSVGVVLCQVLTGRVPFLKDTDLDTLNYIKKGPEVRAAAGQLAVVAWSCLMNNRRFSSSSTWPLAAEV